jgi:hypothetical protein
VGAGGPLTPSVVYTASGKFDIALSKFDANGNYLWSQAWGGPLIDQPISLVVDEVNNVYVAGMVTRTVGGSLFNPVVTSTASLAKIASDGTLQWTKTWGGTGDDAPAGMALDGAGNLYVPGQFQHTIDFNPDSGVDNISARGVLDVFLSKFLALPAAPALVAPPDGTVTTTQAITLAWQAGAGNAPVGYNVDLDGQVITTSNTVSSTVLANGVHTWTVRAYNAAGYSAWVTPAWTFEITDTLPAPRSPILMSPSNGSLTMTQAITFSWRADTGAAPTGYNVQIDGDVITSTGTSSATVLSMGVHTWTVRAYNGVGYSGWAAPWTVEVRRYDIYLPLVMRNP